MSDYGDENYEDIDYNPDHYDDFPQNDEGVNLEDMFIQAEHSNSIDDFKQIIELERDNASTNHWSFKSYEKICMIYLQQKDLENFSKFFEKLINAYFKVDDCYKTDTVRNFTFALHDIGDNEFSICVLKFMYMHLIEKEVDREVLNTALQLAKILLSCQKDEELGKLLDNIFSFMRRSNSNDEITNTIRLELIIINIQYLNKINEIDECEKLYFEADKLNKEKTINDNRINAIIAEEAGKYNFRLEKYSQALENFKDAYKFYQESGSFRNNIILKYIVLCFILQRNEDAIIDTEEAKKYPDDKMLYYVVELKNAFDRLDIKKINLIIRERLFKDYNDFLIRDNLLDILRNLRVNYLLKKLRLYRYISLGSIEKDMELDNTTINSLINQISHMGLIEIKLNLVKNCVELNTNSKDEMNFGALKGFHKWENILS